MLGQQGQEPIHNQNLVEALHPTEIVTTSYAVISDDEHPPSSSELQAQIQHSVEADGTLRLFPSKGMRTRITKLKKTVTFEPRLSPFDRFNPTSAADTFRGFHTLFWILMAIISIRTFFKTYALSGHILGMTFGRLIGKDGLVLALSDAVLVGSTVVCVPFMQLVEQGWIRYQWTGLVIQHVAQALFLGSAIRWTFFRFVAGVTCHTL